jgi:branched-chain amino acid transport system permease protein
MDLSYYLVQSLHSVQLGFLLFLVASGLTLIFGILGVVNLAHGSFYMLGAYLVYWLNLKTGDLLLAVALGVPASVLVGLVVERLAIRFLYSRDHLYQVLLTYGLILVFNELQRILWGNDVHGVAIPPVLEGSFVLTETQTYPLYRVFISVACVAVAAAMYLVIHKTKLGMLIRAGASNREMVDLLGFRVRRLYAIVFALGTALTAFAGMLSAPVNSVYPGMGEQILIMSFVIVVIGGLGSIQGAFVGAMLIGFIDTFGKVLLPEVASFAVYAFMAAVLVWRPQGLFGPRPA